MENLVKRKLTVREILDAMPHFREWIQETKLYNVLVEETKRNLGNSIPTRIESDEISINLANGTLVRTPYDLPIELLQNFFINSPFYNINVELSNLYLPPSNQIENDNNN